jgi:hypothetical protein
MSKWTKFVAVFCGGVFATDAVICFVSHQIIGGILAILLGGSMIYNLWFGHKAEQLYNKYLEMKKENEENEKQ